MRASTIDVAVGVLKRADGRVLMAERTPGQLSAGFWELPGGKVDPGETPLQAAVRELAEEIGITALAVRPWIQYHHVFRTRNLRLFFFRIDRWSGEPQGCEGQRLAWVDPANPDVAPILPSVERVLLALGLPALYAVSDTARRGGPERFLGLLPDAFKDGLRLVQVREPAMAPDQRVHFAKRVAGLAQPFGARVVLNGSALEARRAGLGALHSTAAELRRITARPRVSLWMVSCHRAEDLRRAEQLGADAAVISPVLSNAAHPERPTLGWTGFRNLVATAAIPLFAQGGLSPNLLPQAQAAGAAGIATADWA
jgi:8-oxo-dGTP diphosphatase